MVATKFAPLVLTTALIASDTSAARVDPAVHRTLRQQGTVNLMVTMKKGTQDLLSSLKEASFTSRGALIEDMVNRLQQHAEDTQSEINGLVAKEAGGQYVRSESFWLTNQVYFEGATIDFLQRLAAMPSVASIHEEEVFEVPEVETTPMNATEVAGRMLSESGNAWGVEMIQAPAVWGVGYTGEGVHVGMIDSGVRATHEALKDKFLGEFGWYDPTEKKAEPYDDTGHGTHVMGTIVGDRVGVAPGAKWLACKGCKDGSCNESYGLACMQFMTCPTDTKGKKKDCSKAPHVVNNSWSGPPGRTVYQAAIDAWHAAGIIPVFALGNVGRGGCKTAFSPGDYANTIGVGATTSKDTLADFSSKGPGPNGRLKPEISAPGADIYSASMEADDKYTLKSGTSMAAPHVTGAIALMLSANQGGLAFDAVLDTLAKSANTKKIGPSGFACGSSKDGVFPNNMYGHGRLDVLKAVGRLVG